jgi:hypothetical protein
VSAEHLDELASRAPEWLRGSIAAIATAKRESMQPKPPRREPPPAPTSAELDALERELEQLTDAGLLQRSEPPTPKPPD